MLATEIEASGAMKVKGVILCGGEGKRLRPLTYYFQKTMIPIGKKQKPLLEYIVKLLRYHGIVDIVLLVGYKYEQIVNYFEDGSRFGVKINYVQDPKDLKGTGGALLNAFRTGVFDDVNDIVIYYGDILSTISLRDLLSFHRANNAEVTLAVATRYQIPVGVVELKDSEVKRVVEKPWLNIYVTIGILVAKTSVRRYLENIAKEKSNIDIMGDLIPKIILENGKVIAYKYEGLWYDVGSTERFEKLENEKIDYMFKDII